MKCQYCGSILDKGQNFCRGCGSSSFIKEDENCVILYSGIPKQEVARYYIY